MDDRRAPGNQEVIDEIHKTMESHRENDHIFKTDHLKNLVKEHREMYDEDRPLLRDTNRKVTLLVSEMYGTPAPTAADPEHRDGGLIALLTGIQDTLDQFQLQSRNGGITTTRQWTQGQWAFYGALATGWFLLVGTIIASVLGLF